jgi:hypothetical protein
MCLILPRQAQAGGSTTLNTRDFVWRLWLGFATGRGMTSIARVKKALDKVLIWGFLTRQAWFSDGFTKTRSQVFAVYHCCANEYILRLCVCQVDENVIYRTLDRGKTASSNLAWF